MSYQYGKAKQVSIVTHYQVVAQKKQLVKELEAAQAHLRELQEYNIRLDRRVNNISAMHRKEKARADKYEAKYTRLVEQFGKEKGK